MYNFIIVDDNKEYVKYLKNYIKEFKNYFEYQYKIYDFNEYDEEFHNIVAKNLENAIFILDIETPNGNGLDEAEEIHEINDDYKIIIISSYILKYNYKILQDPDFYIGCVFKDNKMQKFKQDVFKLIKKAINKYNKNDSLIIKEKGSICKTYINDITYIESNNRITIIHRLWKEDIKTKTPLKKYEKQLPGNFKRSHKSCIINLDHVFKINSTEKNIIFDDETMTDLISRNYKNEIIMAFENSLISYIEKENNNTHS